MTTRMITTETSKAGSKGTKTSAKMNARLKLQHNTARRAHNDG